jgi:hypothetical protein
MLYNVCRMWLSDFYDKIRKKLALADKPRNRLSSRTKRDGKKCCFSMIGLVERFAYILCFLLFAFFQEVSAYILKSFFSKLSTKIMQYVPTKNASTTTAAAATSTTATSLLKLSSPLCAKSTMSCHQCTESAVRIARAAVQNAETSEALSCC